jgi:ribosome-associated protein
MIEVAPNLQLEEGELDISFIRASGPGGQNVNKVSSAVQLRFDLLNSPSIPEPMKRRVAAIAGKRLTKDGVIVLTANSHRDQPMNRQEAQARLVALLAEGAHVPKPRLATRPTLASKKRRLEGKAIRSTIKQMRNVRPEGD